MNKLLNANFYRLKKNYCFWIMLIIISILGFYMYINNSGFHPENCVNCNNQFGDIVFGFLSWNWILIPVFISLFVGGEYSNGTIRNKIIGGHKRIVIYLSNLITNIVVIFLYSFSYILVVLITSLILRYDITIPINKFIELLVDSMLLNIVYVSLFTFISMVIYNKTISSVVSLVTVIWSMIITSNIYTKLSLATGTNKIIYEVILKIIPYGQCYQIINLTNNYNYFWLFSIILIILFNFFGIVLFNKKQLN